MEKQFVRNYMLNNGKYLPTSKLNKIGKILEESNIDEYSINIRYFSPLLTTIIFWVFYPIQLFDRLILKDWFLGSIKAFIIPLILTISAVSGGYDSIYEQYNSNDNGDFASTLAYYLFNFILIIWLIWVVIDGFTIYRRTKFANYNALRRTIGKLDSNYTSRKKESIESDEKALNKDNEITEWKRQNPNSTINDYYKQKRKHKK